ncbi:hypothetical protein GDO81_020772 [Engystomops pustulosus]|uniref:Uncharacterized protein n=1 Tax=Engystomops pustulosus TaxID=76066 RepID=A0AAV6YRG4_ENGPU|nr:hypothetical protein GDO81_020772 [Engystomops pustulosus]
MESPTTSTCLTLPVLPLPFLLEHTFPWLLAATSFCSIATPELISPSSASLANLLGCTRSGLDSLQLFPLPRLLHVTQLAAPSLCTSILLSPQPSSPESLCSRSSKLRSILSIARSLETCSFRSRIWASR